MKIAALCLILCSFSSHVGAGGKCVSGMGDYAYFPQNRAEFLEPNVAIGYQVIIPQYRFNCSGKIRDWSALTVYEIMGYYPNRDAYFQIWRPTGLGRYKLVGYDKIHVTARDLTSSTNGASPGEGLRFYNISSAAEKRKMNVEGEANNPLYFQPGDIVGFFVRSGELTVPLIVTYRNSTAEDPERLSVDMFYTNTPKIENDGQVCQMSECGEDINRIDSVIPHLFFTYDELSPDEVPPSPTRNCYNSTRHMEDCPVPSSSPIPTSSFLPSPTAPSPPLQHMYVWIAVGVGSGAIILALASGICMAIMCFIMQRKPAAKTQFATNVTYVSTNEAPYSVTDSTDSPSYPDGIISTTAYASTYQTNAGEIHMYQELDNLAVSHPPHTPHFALHMGTGHDSVHSVSGDAARPSLPPHFISSPTLWTASSMHPGSADPVGSLRQAASLLPHLPVTSMPVVPGSSHPRGSSPVWCQQKTQQPLLPKASSFHQPTGKSSPSPSPPLCSPSPHGVGNTAAPYSLPVPKPWYKSDYEPATVAGVARRGDEGEGYLVPTMEERSNIGNEDIYFHLKRPHREHKSREILFFEESDNFWEPAQSTAGIYQQLASKNYREIHRAYIKIQRRLGSGHFGTVYKGFWKCPRGEEEVAIKLLQSGASDEDRVKFLQEAAIMGQFRHPNVVKLHGVVTLGDPLMMVIELMSNKDLKQYLNQYSKRSSKTSSPSSQRPVLSIPPNLPHTLLSFCRQVANGMDYLSKKGFVHRDLAARNILLNEDLTCKIGDFGLARNLGKESIYHSCGGQVAIKWTAPEALSYLEYSSNSDVWSYGMVLFEIWSLGHRPFHGLTESDMATLIGNHHCQPPPPGCSQPLYKLMTLCWNPDPQMRPTFSSIRSFLQASEDSLLSLPDPSPSLSPFALQLGAPLGEAKNLYLDLQYCYDESVV